MNSQFYPQGRSPPPLQHPIPTHAHYQIPEPPDTPGAPEGAQGYMRFTSPQAQQSMRAGQGQQGVFMQQPQPQYGGGGFHQPQPQPAGFQAWGNGPQQQQPHPNGIPNLAAFGVDNATAQMGVQLGKSAMAAGQDYVEKNFGSYFLPVSMMKHQFNVSNSYVLNKLRIVVFPWRHRPWSRKVRRSEASGQSEGYQPPREDINSPDLYIPTMALVTYVLLTALVAGMNNRFHPEVLGVGLSKAFAVLIMDVAFVKLGCYTLNIQSSAQVVDLAAYGGYKFVGAVAVLLASMVLGRKLWWCVFFYFFGAIGFFLLRSLRYVVLPDPNTQVGNSTVTHAQRGWRVRFLFIVAMTQILYMAILVLM
ncbi:hypothetical protein FS837_001829 [Tulasnella sp. UAMH 9824]|nr:hypothetical protein FS837_001829 [Tulasnella sp. UAMH 9824]